MNRIETVSVAKFISAGMYNPLFKQIYNVLDTEYTKSIVCTIIQAYDRYVDKSQNSTRDVWKILKYERNQ